MLKVDISGMIQLAKEVGIPFWEFELATGIRETIQYPDMGLEELKEYNLRAFFQLSDTAEQLYALQLKLVSTLEELARQAETDEEIFEVIRNLPTYYVSAGDIACEKRRHKEDPEGLRQHNKLVKVDLAKRDAELGCCETVDEVYRLAARHLSGDYPLYDTHTNRAFMKLIELTDDIEMLKWVRTRSLVWHQSRLASVRKIAALTKYVNRGL